jgi:ABC-type molybdenum transport system ATPase subunit/photorepair protein PhrA
MTELSIEATGLVKTFGKTRALRGVDLAVRKATVHAVLGPNGAGKTTCAAGVPRAGWLSGGTGSSDSPVMPRGSRLVVTMRSRGQCASSASARPAQASMRCSQLSRTRRALTSARPSSSRVRASRLAAR